jgi:uncharacterized membrane protein YcaP (DUF421 family)
MLHDFRFAFRQLVKARAFTAAAIIVLALALGLTVLLHGVSMSAFLAIAIVWLVPTCLFARLRRRNARL